MRLKNFDYSQPGFYFITICTKKKGNVLGEIREEIMWLNQFGEILKECWFDLPEHYDNCRLDEFVIMPNHFHAIVEIIAVVNGLQPFSYGLQPFREGPLHGLSEIIRAFKTFSSKKINQSNQLPKFQWQQSFYDRVVRNEEELHKIREYIINNPAKWELDSYFIE